MQRRFLPVPPVLLLITVCLSACNSVGYYAQSVAGQYEVIAKRKPIESLLHDAELEPALKSRLRQALEVRNFASGSLGLPDNQSFRHYADLGRPFVVWNVFAAPPLEMRLESWCFPVAGCVNYRGYFKQTAAEDYAAQLRQQGLDTYVGGVAAYSTLGWFDDPLLNTVMRRSPARLAGLMFYDLAHQQLYVKGDTAFNEAFATTVELEGVRRWLAQIDDPAQSQAYDQFQQRQSQFVELVTRTRNALVAIYANAGEAAEQQQGKQRVIAEMRRQYQGLKDQWQGYTGYDRWFAGEINNARLASVTAYRDHVPAFQALLQQQGGDLPAFYLACAALAALPQAERLAALERLAPARLVRME